MENNKQGKVIIDFHTIVDPVKLAYALLLFVPQYKKIGIPEYIRNIYLTRDFTRTDIKQKHDLIELDDFPVWRKEIGNFEEDKGIIEPGNFAASIQLLQLGIDSGVIEFVSIPKETDLSKTISSLQSSGIDEPYFLEMINLDTRRTGLNTLSPRCADTGFLLNMSLCDMAAYKLSISNPEIPLNELKVMSLLGIKPVLRSNPISEVLTRKAFPSRPSDVFLYLEQFPLFEEIASHVSMLEREKAAKSDLTWFFPKLIVSTATGGLSAIAEFSYLLLNYVRAKKTPNASKTPFGR